MKPYIVETTGDFRVSDITSFDKDAIVNQIIANKEKNETSIWSIHTKLYASQLLLFKTVLRLGIYVF